MKNLELYFQVYRTNENFLSTWLKKEFHMPVNSSLQVKNILIMIYIKCYFKFLQLKCD